jgi:hypothetical protein
MKRLVAITACMLVFFAAAASAWASCQRVSDGGDIDGVPARHAHGHDHHDHGGAGHDHSENPLIHCAPVTDFLPAATFSFGKDSRLERLAHLLPIESHSQWRQNALSRWVHGPPDSNRTENTPAYLLISVLRI